MEILGRESRPQPAFRRCPILLFAATGCLVWSTLGIPQDSIPPARLTYSKVLKGSSPEYLCISVDTTGNATYEGRKLDDPSSPHPMKLSPATTGRLFQLAEALDNFQSLELESHKKVANLGFKTFTYEHDGRTNKVEFNYTLRREAQALTDLFERISGVIQHIMVLEHAIKYDHLSLPKELVLIRMDLDKRALADPELLVPALEKIVRNPRFLHLAQSRAQDILQRLQNNN